MKNIKKAFTLIELLVVIAIIAILAAILFPVFAQAKAAAKKTVALSNAKQIALALRMYSTDYDDMYVYIRPPATPINGGGYAYMPIEYQLFPYVKNWDVYFSPGDQYPILTPRADSVMYDPTNNYRKRSFMPMGNISTLAGGAIDPNTGIGTGYAQASRVVNGSNVTAPGDTILVAESWFNSGLTAIGSPLSMLADNCQYAYFPGRNVPPQGDGDTLTPGCISAGYQAVKPADGYAGRTANYLFGDGHAKSMTFGPLRKNDFYIFKLDKPTTVVSP